MGIAASAELVSSFESVPGNFLKGATHSWHQRRRHHSVLQLLSGLEGNVLDYGCGYGDITYAISKTHPVTGCDVDGRRIRFAASQYPTIRWAQCGTESTPFEDQSFDVVVSAVVIHFVPDAARHLAEIHRLLRPAGTLLLLCQNQPAVRNALRRAVGRGKAPTALWVPTMAQMKAMVGEAGFEIFRSTFFYDPPIEPWKSVGDCAIGCVQQFLSLLRVRSTAEYYGYSARKCLARAAAGRNERTAAASDDIQ